MSILLSGKGVAQMKKPNMTLERRNSWTGRMFVLPFYVGIIFFFLRPLYQSIRFSFSDVTVESGYYAQKFIGLGNYRHIFTVDLYFLGNLVNTIGQLAWRVPVIIISSLFISMMLNQNFRGRTIVRAICFLPVIIASGVILDSIKMDMVAANAMKGNVISSGTIFQSTALNDLLVQAGFAQKIVVLFITIANNVFDVIYNGGIQMLMFLAGLQSISPTLYEAASVEGASDWESFWKITLPLMSPIILINVVYTIVDCFTSSQNAVMKQVLAGIELLRFGESSAMLWTYCFLIMIVLGLVFLLFKRAKSISQ